MTLEDDSSTHRIEIAHWPRVWFDGQVKKLVSGQLNMKFLVIYSLKQIQVMLTNVRQFVISLLENAFTSSKRIQDVFQRLEKMH